MRLDWMDLLWLALLLIYVVTLALVLSGKSVSSTSPVILQMGGLRLACLRRTRRERQTKAFCLLTCCFTPGFIFLPQNCTFSPQYDTSRHSYKYPSYLREKEVIYSLRFLTVQR